MGLVNVFSIVYILAMFILYVTVVLNKKTVTMGVKQKNTINWLNLAILLFVGLLVRILLAKLDPGYDTDMNCFSAWSDWAYKDGLANYYNIQDRFTDYTPGYIYILWIVGWFRHAFPALTASTIIVKMPAILFDLATCALIYKVARRHFDEKGAMVLAGFYLFNPVILVDSAMWGQVDSVFTFFIVWMAVLIADHKLIPSYFVFAISILMKPQALVLTPILIYGILDQVFFNDYSAKRFFRHLGYGLLAILFMFVCTIPFHFDQYWITFAAKSVTEGTKTWLPVAATAFTQATGNILIRLVQMLFGVLALYTGTLSSYEYATVNAYNFWGMLGLNWHSQTEKALGVTYATWGMLFIILLVVAATVLCYLNRKKTDGSKYFLIGAFIAAGFFTLSVRVHERYMFPIFALLLLAFLFKPRKSYLFIFMGLTLVQVNNIWHAFKFYPDHFDWKAKFPRVVGVFHLLLFLCLVIVLVKDLILERKKAEETVEESLLYGIKKDGILMKLQEHWKDWKPRKSQEKWKLTKFDWTAIAVITLVYAAIALFNLGDMHAPETYWETYTQGDTLNFDFSNKTSNLTKLAYFDGRYENREFYVEESADNVNWTPVAVNAQDLAFLGGEASKFTMSSVFCWGTADIAVTQPYVRLRCNSNETVLNELVFFDEQGNKIQPVNAKDYANLFDEQKEYPTITTFNNSTYFDEIYHARTAYEMTQHVYNYEWTHPPLGKFIMSIGIRIFGMCPFGWRIMGTLFGIAMLPIFYLFSRKLFQKSWVAAVTTTLFAADFMHFTQTRIATIDVYVTFFIILMFYFMYQYYCMSFYDTPLKKTFVPLLFSGIFMGLGCASKWPGVYAGVGLGIVFFIVVFRRYMEYHYAWLHPKEETNGIKNEVIIKGFKKNLILTLAFCVLAFVIIPGTIYTLSYIPFNNGQDMGLIQRMIKNQVDMWNYHSKLDATHPFSSTWYQWPIMQRPIWYYTATIKPAVEGVSGAIQGNISAFGNPLVWWAGIPAFAYMLYRCVRFKDKKAIFLSVAYMAQLTPWMGVTRCTFIYHYFPSVPFITIMIGYSMYHIYESCKTNKGRKNVKLACIVYAACAIGLFIMFYPVISGYPIDVTYVAKFLRWFSSWQLASV